MANTSLKLTGLDYDSLRNNFKNFLKRADSPFKDVDFEGSNISQLLDILAYNTYNNAFYLNMVASEMFLDSAQLRDSVISHAKELNYVPRSYRSAEATISFNVTPSTSIDSLLIPKGTSFTTKIGSNNYIFTTPVSTIHTANASGVVNVSELSIFEGTFVTDTFIYSTSNSDQRFVLSNPTVDTRSITITVLENEGANTYTYTQATSFLGHTANSQVYYIQAAENSQYEIKFGDNIVSKRPQNGSTIVAEYRICNGELPNGAATFSIDGPIQGQSNISVISTDTQARGGGVTESLESIKFNAPRSYQNQDRAITSSDFENLLRQSFPEIESVAVYGGEELDPPQFGRVVVAIDTVNNEGITEADKAEYTEFLSTRSTVGITPLVVNPDFLYVEIDVTVTYNINNTNLDSEAMKTLAKNEISTYNTTYLNDFNKSLRYSQLVEDLNKIHDSVVSVDVRLHPFVRLNPTPGLAFNKTILYNIELDTEYSLSTGETDYVQSEVHAIFSSRFQFEGSTATIQDDRAGKLVIYRLDENNQNVFVKNIGTVDYLTGKVNIEGLLIENTGNFATIRLYANPRFRDITASKNTIITVRDSDIEAFTKQIRE